MIKPNISAGAVRILHGTLGPGRLAPWEGRPLVGATVADLLGARGRQVAPPASEGGDVSGRCRGEKLT
jgi:hypothetical protein